ncbi:MAG: MopE-related protein, partial [Bradymonadia bacterium]
GPGILTQGGTQYVAGVNSTVSGESPTCLLASNQMRVDAYQSWIDYVMGNDQNCGSNQSLCQCAAACTSDGYCDHTQCGELDCSALAQCTSNCTNGLCASSCYARSSSDAKRGYVELADCASRRCANGDSFCLQDNCGDEIEFCYGDDAFPSGERSCGDVYACVNGCSDSTCAQNCYISGTLDAQRNYSEFYDCLYNRCADLQSDYTAFNQCLANSCGTTLYACMPDERCELLGGDCGSGRACTLEGWGATYCRISSNVEPLGSCNAAQITCTDGHYCRNLGDGPRCYENCYTDADCAAGTRCRTLRGAAVDFGQCEAPCEDQDQDGDCDSSDCEPMNPSIFTDGEEACGDGLDGDCDGTVDEGCAACTDSDGDGSCDEQDCAPFQADQSPNLPEVCGDGVDNNCDGQADEGCSTICDLNDPACGQPGSGFAPDPEPSDDGCAQTVHFGRRPWLAGLLMLVLVGVRRHRFGSVSLRQD